MPDPATLRDLAAPRTVLADWQDAMRGWLGSDWHEQAVSWLVAKPLALALLLVVAVAARWALHRLIDRLVHRAVEGLPTPVLRRRPEDRPAEDHPGAFAASRRVQRAATMGSLLKSIASVVIVTVTAITVIAELGYPVGPLLASAGVVGVALGFGAQSLVKDFLAGICMIFEDQYGVGDVVTLGQAAASSTGTVEAVGLRITRIRDVEGTVWYVRNGEMIRVGNQSQNWARTVLDVPVALEEDLHRVQDVLRDVTHDLWDDEDYRDLIIEEPEVWGVQDLTADQVLIRVTLKTAPLEQWAVARELRLRVKIRFDHEGIALAQPPAA